MIDSTSLAAARSSNCMDCGAPISGNYCSNCGQETKIETPTVRQFAHEMMDQYVAVEGKLGRTLRVLLSRPGQLTLDYVEGRRQRYVRPLKLYVSVSVVFFTLLGVLPDSLSPFTKADPKAEREGSKALQQVQKGDVDAATKPAADEDKDSDNDGDKAKPAAPAAAVTPATPTPKAATAQPAQAAAEPPLSGNLRQQIKQQIDAQISAGNAAGQSGDKAGHKPPGFDPAQIDADVHRQVDNALHEKGIAGGFESKAKAFASLSPQEQQKALRAKLADDAPYAMFFLLPYFAFLLRVLYRKNRLRYGVHLLFSVHLHCFVFIVLGLGFLPLPGFLRTGLELAIAAYVYFALHKVYGGTWGRTLWRMALLYVFYIVAVGATAVSGVISAVLGGGST